MSGATDTVNRQHSRSLEHLSLVVGSVGVLDLLGHGLDLVNGVRDTDQVSPSDSVQRVTSGTHFPVDYGLVLDHHTTRLSQNASPAPPAPSHAAFKSPDRLCERANHAPFRLSDKCLISQSAHISTNASPIPTHPGIHVGSKHGQRSRTVPCATRGTQAGADPRPRRWRWPPGKRTAIRTGVRTTQQIRR